MLALGASFETKDANGKCALHYLVIADTHGHCTQWLLAQDLAQNKFNINAVTNGGVTALMLAVNAQNARTVEELLKVGANPLLKDNLEDDALEYLRNNNEIKAMLIASKEQWINK